MDAKATHEPRIGYTAKRIPFPWCSCGWKGDETYDHGEATRKAYAHALRENRALSVEVQ